ncbi:odorant receptor 83a-like isoform X1 [Cryptotermes secundus]|uniref:odorant receptor 83a-like isoform X1 n=1 Tax=Cryptotermes secundus TaxID=105785 RepID=UPI001454CB30|nr:odorant receptor 83a-like isoform X1 [Cryptotermes secundus]
MAGWIQRIQPMMWRLNFCDWGTHLLYFILRGVAGNGKPFFFNSWFPLDTDDIASYTLVIIMQALGSVMIGTTLFAVMGLYVTLVSVGCTQLEKIQAALLDIKQHEPSEMNTRLAECVTHHQYVLRYMKELEKTFSPVLFGPFLLVVAALCFTAYTAITLGGKFVEFIQIFIITAAMMFQIQAVCWFGTQLTQQSGRVRDAAWDSDWVGAPVSFQRSIIFMISVSKEFKLTAGKIIPVYQSTVMTVLNETYTYLMVLVNFVDKSSRTQ